MRKSVQVIAIAVASISFAAIAPVHAASRLMSSSPDGFHYRCEKHGGTFDVQGYQVSCDMPSLLISCEYFDARRANCNWPGIEQSIVVRVIGTLPGGDYVASTSGGGGSDLVSSGGGGGGSGGGGGGFQGPKDIKAAPDNNPSPGFNGPKDFQIAP